MLESQDSAADNDLMTTTHKKQSKLKPKRLVKTLRRRGKAAKSEPHSHELTDEQDLAMRNKISESLDMEALLAHHARSAEATKKYWETPE